MEITQKELFMMMGRRDGIRDLKNSISKNLQSVQNDQMNAADLGISGVHQRLLDAQNMLVQASNFIEAAFVAIEKDITSFTRK